MERLVKVLVELQRAAPRPSSEGVPKLVSPATLISSSGLSPHFPFVAGAFTLVHTTACGSTLPDCPLPLVKLWVVSSASLDLSLLLLLLSSSSASSLSLFRVAIAAQLPPSAATSFPPLKYGSRSSAF